MSLAVAPVDDDNLVRYFAIHTVAVQAEGGSPATIRLYDGRYKQFLTFLHEQGHTPPFDPELLNTFASLYLVRHPGDESGLRGALGHLSPDQFRVYTHIAAELIAQRAGRVSLSEAWLGEDGAA